MNKKIIYLLSVVIFSLFVFNFFTFMNSDISQSDLISERKDNEMKLKKNEKKDEVINTISANKVERQVSSINSKEKELEMDEDNLQELSEEELIKKFKFVEEKNIIGRKLMISNSKGMILKKSPELSGVDTSRFESFHNHFIFDLNQFDFNKYHYPVLVKETKSLGVLTGEISVPFSDDTQLEEIREILESNGFEFHKIKMGPQIGFISTNSLEQMRKINEILNTYPNIQSEVITDLEIPSE